MSNIRTEGKTRILSVRVVEIMKFIEKKIIMQVETNEIKSGPKTLDHFQMLIKSQRVDRFLKNFSRNKEGELSFNFNLENRKNR